MRFRTIWILRKESPTDRLGKNENSLLQKCLVNLYLCSEAVNTTLLCIQKVLLQALFRGEEPLQLSVDLSFLCLKASLLSFLYENHPRWGKSWCSSLLCLKGFKIPIFLLIGKGVPQSSKCSKGWGGEAWCISSAFKELKKEFQVQWSGQSEGMWFMSQTVKTLSGFTWTGRCLCHLHTSARLDATFFSVIGLSQIIQGCWNAESWCRRFPKQIQYRLYSWEFLSEKQGIRARSNFVF